MKKIILMCLIGMISFCSWACSGKETTEMVNVAESTTEQVVTDATTTEEVTEFVLDSIFNKQEEKTDTTGDDSSSGSSLIDLQNRQQNNADFLVQDNWIYGLDWDSNGNGIFAKQRLDGGDYTKLDNLGAKSLHIKDSYIYYVVTGEGDKTKNGIYKMRTSGTD